MALVDSDERLVFHQRIRLPYRYTTGDQTKAFLLALAERRILGSRCEECRLTLVPARPFCPICAGRTGALVEVSDAGTLERATVRIRDEGPVTFGLIRLDGADTAFLHRLEVAPERLRSGLRVVARWDPDPAPEITAISCFVEPGASEASTGDGGG